ncbi:MAG: 6,7-dimethyl-8-ribityllumazine synthase [Clostridium sp.]|nr:6,7-dimethyl-8-ribityllumazine synthase [Clostridium sp.]
MSTSRPVTPIPELSDARVAIAVADWNGHITGELADGAVRTLRDNGFDEEDIAVYHVPGAVELTYAASQIIESSLFDAVIVFGCVVRGDTPHFDYVCQSVTQGVTALNADCDIPVIFGVLTVENEQQALDRAGGPAGHKGCEAAEAAIRMIAFKRQFD